MNSIYIKHINCYSYEIAWRIFCLDARIAGIIAARIPAIIEIPIHCKVCSVETTNVSKPWSSIDLMRLHANNIPNPVPKKAPNIEIIEDSKNIIRLI